MSQNGISIRHNMKSLLLGTFEEIYAEHYKDMFRVASRMIADHDTVSDILQEIFIDLYKKLDNGYEVHHPRRWLYRATCNKCVDVYRKGRNFQNIDSALNRLETAESMDQDETRTMIDQALSKLKPKERSLAVLYSEGLSYKEIAAATGIRFSSIGKMLSRTFKKIERECKKLGYEMY